MILQFFPRVIPVRDSVFGVNTLGMLEIFPKPSGITVYSHPTTMSTHAVRDEFIRDGAEYDHTGFKLLEHDDGCECLIISNAMRGGYKQIGLHQRDPYTRRNKPPYVPPNARNPPRPWSVRLTEPRLRPIEICYTRAGMVNAFLGKAAAIKPGEGKDVTRNLSAAVVGAPANTPSWLRTNLVRVTEPQNTLHRGSLILNPSKRPNTQDFVCNVYMMTPFATERAVDIPFSAKYPSSGMLGDEFIQNYAETPVPESIMFPAQASVFLPPPIRETTRIYENVFDYEEGQGVVPPRSRASHPVVYLSPNCITRYKEWVGQTGERAIPTAREFPMDWLVVVANVSDIPKGADDSPYPPVLFVPHILAFHPINGGEGPIDSRTGRRWCNGECLMVYLTTSPVEEMFPSKARVALSLHQISRPITNAAFFTPPVDLSKLLGIDIGDDKRLAEKHEAEMVVNAVNENERIKRTVVLRIRREKAEEEINAP